MPHPTPTHPDPPQRPRRRRAFVAVLAAAAVAALLVPPRGALADGAEAKLAELDRRAASVARTQNASRGRLDEIAAEQRRLAVRRAEAEARGAQSTTAIRNWAVAAYKSGGLYLAALFDTDSATALAARTAVLDRLARTARRSAASAAAAADDAADASGRLDELAAAERRTIAQLDAERRSLAAAQAEQQRIIASRPPPAPPAPPAPASAAAAGPGAPAAAAAPAAPAARPAPQGGRPADAAPTPAGAPDTGGGSDQGMYEITCYAGEQPTASGERVRPGVAATDWRVIPKGRSFRLEGLGTYTALDTGGVIKGRKIDIWNASEAWCRRFGRQQRRLFLL